MSNHSKKSISISRCFSSWKTLLKMYSLKGYILSFHRLSFHRLPFYMSLSSLETKSVKVGMFNGKELFWQLWCFLVEYQIIALPFRDKKANGVTFDWVPFYSLPTLFEQSINHYFRSCTFAYWELCLIVFFLSAILLGAFSCSAKWQNSHFSMPFLESYQQTLMTLQLYPNHWF